MSEKEYFFNKSYCELIITSKEVSPGIIAEALDIIPNRQYTKGEEFSLRHSGTIGKRFQNLWAINSEVIVSEKENISAHILFFKKRLESKDEILKTYKLDKRFEITFWVWIETENTSFGIELDELETFFLNSISNSIRFSILTQQSMG